MVFGLAPLWVKKVRENGVAATAVVLGDPQNREHVLLIDDVNKLLSYRVKE